MFNNIYFIPCLVGSVFWTDGGFGSRHGAHDSGLCLPSSRLWWSGYQTRHRIPSSLSVLWDFVVCYFNGCDHCSQPAHQTNPREICKNCFIFLPFSMLLTFSGRKMWHNAFTNHAVSFTHNVIHRIVLYIAECYTLHSVIHRRVLYIA